MDRKTATLFICMCWSLPAWAAPHLDSNTASQLRRAPNITVLVLQPDAPMGAYLRMGFLRSVPASSGAMGGAVGGIMGGMIDEHHRNLIVQAMAPYTDIIQKQGFPEREFALAQQAFAPIAWMQKASWKQLGVTAGDRRGALAKVKASGTQAVLVLAPETRMRDDFNQLMTDFVVDLYLRNPYAEDGYDHAPSSTIASVGPQDPPDTYPPLDYTKTGQDDVTANSVKLYFADGGVKLGQDFASSLPGLKAALAYYLTGIEAPPAATH